MLKIGSMVRQPVWLGRGWIYGQVVELHQTEACILWLGQVLNGEWRRWGLKTGCLEAYWSLDQVPEEELLLVLTYLVL